MFIVAEDDGSYVQRVRLAAVVATGNTESGADITARDIALRWYLSVGNGEADNLVE